MPWKCHICETSNPDYNSKCEVCGADRDGVSTKPFSPPQTLDGRIASEGKNMKNFIISILEPILSLFVIIATLLGFIFGGLSDSDSRIRFDWIGAAIGGLATFLVSVIVTGPIFILLTIKDLLEEQVQRLRQRD
jgi:hypothetical protein